MNRCGEVNKKVSGWPAKLPAGCGHELQAIQYRTAAFVAPDGKLHEERPSVCLVCPVCDYVGIGGSGPRA